MEHNLDRVEQLARQLDMNYVNGNYNELNRFVRDMIGKLKAEEQKKAEQKAKRDKKKAEKSKKEDK